ncbi:MCP four helix bundle domain-containing protein [Fulvivirga kasyanovii]|uniref:Chemotaxis methyl-accepting receptor HlyB-like 4HB MCP domain-containing protein n=1 Tax=Fulvivirga kasyanovii TaxID=396812 RepID=A0ABW9RXI8_9BACT|nr:MCP four helix bundle domain-containing protein [Fulvivirga kasyanovii]MTI28943.1 hypothetical protein [Fulvivirga kasyanovii]
MKLNLTIGQKVKALIVLVLFFLLLLATNKIDNNHFKVVKKSMSTIYEDRLVAQDYIYKLSQNLQSKGLSLAINDKVNYSLNDSINYLVQVYEETKFTSREAKCFDSFKVNLDQLHNLEQEFKRLASSEVKQKIYQQHNVLNMQLDKLAEIQLKEGKRQTKISNRSISTSDLISNMEIAALIIIGLLINALIFIKPNS